MSTSRTVCLKDASDAKLTADRSFHMFTISQQKSTPRALRPWFIQFVRMTSVFFAQD